MSTDLHRRRFLKDLGIGLSALPFVAGLSSLRTNVNAGQTAFPRKRFVVMFSPNGTLPNEFWPDVFGNEPLSLKPILAPLAPYREQMLILKGIDNKIRGDGDGHMRGMSCLLTARELNPGNIQGGSDSPAGWASGISIDQHLRNHFQSYENSRTRFGSLEFGVAVPNRADPWTRMCYAGNNKPVAPIDDPAQMFNKLYGGGKDQAHFASVIDPIRDDLKRLSTRVSPEDRSLLEEHLELVGKLEKDIAASRSQSDLDHPEPDIDPDIELVNDNTPAISRMQIDLLINALANDMTRVASLQYMRSVGQARMRWLDVKDGHHSLSHKPDKDLASYEKLRRINVWFANELAYLTKRLSETPEPGGIGGTMLDYTQIIWVNELGKGNSHTLDNIPFVFIGGGAGFRMNRALDFDGVPHNRLWLTLARAMGDPSIQSFGTERFCVDGMLNLS